MAFYPAARRIDRRAIAYLVCTVLVPIIVYFAYAQAAFYIVSDPNVFLVFHAFVEIFTVVVAAAIAYVSFMGYRGDGSRTILLLGTAFLAQAALDTIHSLAYPGMPNLFFQPGSNQAIYAWLFARISGAILLLLSAALPERETPPKMRTRILLLAVAAVAFLSITCAYAVKELVDVLPPMFIQGEGLTLLKIGLEDLVALTLAITGLSYLRNYMHTANKTILMFTIGVTLFIFSEIGFMLYKNVYDIYNITGHIFKLAAFTAFLIGLIRAR